MVQESRFINHASNNTLVTMLPGGGAALYLDVEGAVTSSIWLLQNGVLVC